MTFAFINVFRRALLMYMYASNFEKNQHKLKQTEGFPHTCVDVNPIEVAFPKRIDVPL